MQHAVREVFLCINTNLCSWHKNEHPIYIFISSPSALHSPEIDLEVSHVNAILFFLCTLTVLPQWIFRVRERKKSWKKRVASHILSSCTYMWEQKLRLKCRGRRRMTKSSSKSGEIENARKLSFSRKFSSLITNSSSSAWRYQSNVIRKLSSRYFYNPRKFFNLNIILLFYWSTTLLMGF